MFGVIYFHPFTLQKVWVLYHGVVVPILQHFHDEKSAIWPGYLTTAK